ncbi:hypothetical protein B0H10DRAFT_2159848 [Mycena sp. CBHHK59/15]|nr:hypothetical protein B0H10DRAFT_2159848 [Mycena sp. CBHHK59/15]
MTGKHALVPATFACPKPHCRKLCKSAWGLTHHRESIHLRLPRAATPANNTQHDQGPGVRENSAPPISPPLSLPPSPPPRTNVEYHPILDGTPCDKNGYDLPPDSLPPPWEEQALDDYSAFNSRAKFEFAEFLYRDEEMAGQRINHLSQLLAALYKDMDPPSADHKDLYSTIDVIQQGDVPWQSFSVTYTGPLPESEKYEVWFRSPLGIFEKQLANPDFKDEMDWAPKRIFKGGKHQYVDLFSGNWVWEQADKIAKDENTHGTMFVPSVLGSDKTTVSVGTGNTEFYPLYGGVGNIYNSTRHAHCDGLLVMAFLSIPKMTRDHSGSMLFHSSLHHILSPLKPHMTIPHVTRCADGHFRRVIYGLGPYIADYPEQALLTSIVQGWCPRSDDFGIVGDLVPFTTGFPHADIHELILMDLLHQVIKPTFKDHIVDWVEEYICAEHEKPEADRILADIDRRIAVTPPFPGLRHFHVGHGYKQWTGNDSKGLMKVYLPATAGHAPSQVVQAIADIVEFCHLVRLSLPRQHSIVHYRVLIQLFGAPNGLCSSITESKHIKAVKRPYRRTSHNKPLSQMLLTNQRLDKLAAARMDFTARGMMDGALLPLPPPPPHDSLPPPPENPDDECFDHGAMDGPTFRRVPRDVDSLAVHMDQPRLCELICSFLFDQFNPNAPIPGGRIALSQCPDFSERIFLYNSARAVFYAPSDVSGVGGMHHERIRATKSWYRGPPRYDCVFLEHDKDLPGFRGLHAARVRMLFRFKYCGIDYPCALIHWFSAQGDQPCPDMGMWIVTPDSVRGGGPSLSVVHLDCLLRSTHLIGVAGKEFIPIRNLDFSDSLDAFKAFYVNKYADHHAHEIAF